MTYNTETPVRIIPEEFYRHLKQTLPNTTLPDDPNPQEAAYRLGVQRVLNYIENFVKWRTE